MRRMRQWWWMRRVMRRPQRRSRFRWPKVSAESNKLIINIYITLDFREDVRNWILGSVAQEIAGRYGTQDTGQGLWKDLASTCLCCTLTKSSVLFWREEKGTERDHLGSVP